LLDNGFSDKEARTLLIDNKLYIDDILYEDSIITTLDDTIYYHYELQIHSKPGGFDPETCTIIKEPYYLEMKYRYTIDGLLEYYYSKISVPIHFRDIKRDKGAFNHILDVFVRLGGTALIGGRDLAIQILGGSVHELRFQAFGDLLRSAG
jgi:hypothetical protein